LKLQVGFSGERFVNIDLMGQSALVTGAAGGIGKAVCNLLADCGAKVAWCDRPEQADRLADYGVPSSQIITGDITDPDDARQMTAQAASQLGGLDILINCAGVSAVTGRTTNQRLEDWKRVMDINLQGTFLMCQAAGSHFCTQRSGKVINLSSAVALAAVPGDSAYGVAKAGVIALTKSLALEWAPRNVRVNCVVPGVIDAGMFQISDETWREQFLKRTPMGRFGKPNEIASAIAFLVSDHASFITGATLPVDGGWVAYGGLGVARDGR
jgi:NAD(P)-dependent dehydrogenase (short-subunit alcohol dehydrogenase family)